MHFLPLNQFEELRRLLITDHEHDFHRQIARQLEEMVFMQDAVPAKPSNGAKSRTAVDAQLLGLFQQPFIEQNAVMPAMLGDVELQIDTFQEAPSVINPFMIRIPSRVIVTEPIT